MKEKEKSKKETGQIAVHLQWTELVMGYEGGSQGSLLCPN